MKIGLAQMDIKWEDKQSNKEKVTEFIRKASELDVDLLLFPEMSLTGFSMNIELIGEDNHETLQWFSNAANKYSLNLGFGCTEKKDQKGVNTYYIVGKSSEIYCRYEKIHPFSYGTESKFYHKGNTICTVVLGNFSISPFICYDLRFPEIFQVASKKSHLITIAANWPEERIEHWHVLLKARAIENQCYIAGVNRTGNGGGLKYPGESLVIDPLGRIISHEVEIQNGHQTNEKLIIAELQSEIVKNIRTNFSLKDDRREDLYSSYYKTSS